MSKPLATPLPESCPVTVRGPSGKTSPGEVKIQTWDRKQRMKRALKAWAFCWGLALFSVIIPLAHFVLVPVFLLAGPFMAWLLSGQTSIILGGESICPECGAKLPLVRGPDEWPFKDLCSNCQKSVVVEKAC